MVSIISSKVLNRCVESIYLNTLLIMTWLLQFLKILSNVRIQKALSEGSNSDNVLDVFFSFFLVIVDEGTEDRNTTKIGPLLATSKAFCWWADNGPATLNAGLVFRGSRPVLLRNPIFCNFSGGGV